MKPETIRKILLQRSSQIKIAKWLETTIRPLCDDDIYLDLIKKEPLFAPSPEKIKEIFDTLYPFTIEGSPGHDFGHHCRDVLGASAIIGNDKQLARTYPNDITAAFFAGVYHDIGNGVWPRYKDHLWEAGHAEIGGWLFYHLTEKLLPEHLRRLTAYAICSHTHSLKPINTETGYIREPWSDKIFFTKNRRPVRVSVWITRFADRLDTNGISLLCRHIIAQTNAKNFKGRDLSGKKWYQITDDSLKVLLKPKAVYIEEIPTALMHMKNFADSGKTNTAYSIHDEDFPIMKQLMAKKIKQAEKIISISKTQTSSPNYQLFKKFLVHFSLSPIISKTLNDLDNLWNSLNKTEQEKWGPIFTYCQKNYNTNLKDLEKKINQSRHPLVLSLKPLIPSILKKILLSK